MGVVGSMLSILADGAWLQGHNGEVLKSARDYRILELFSALKAFQLELWLPAAQPAGLSAVPLFNAQFKWLSLKL